MNVHKNARLTPRGREWMVDHSLDRRDVRRVENAYA